MNKFIDADRLKKSIGNYVEGAHAALNPIDGDADYYKGKLDACKDIQEFIDYLQEEQPATAVGKVFTNLAPKNIIVENDQWDKLLGQFDNGQRVRIFLVKEDAE